MSKQVSGVFDHKVVATVKDRTYPSAFRNAIYKALVGNEGVSNQIGNKLSASDISDGIDLKVRLLDGVAFVAGALYRLYDEGSGNFLDLDIDSEQVGLNRIDLVVLEFSSLDVDRVVIAKIVKGIPGVSPAIPSLIQSNVEDAKGVYQIALHQVLITGGNQNAVIITDVRPFYNDLRFTFLNIIAQIAARNELIQDVTGDTVIKSDNIEKIRVKIDGKVGIGTSSPDEKLHVKGNLKVENLAFTENLLIKVLNTLSIFTHTEDAPDAAAGHGGFAFISNAANIGTNDLFTVSNAGGEKFRITSLGKVGIGTINPSHTLSIGDDLGVITTDISLAIGSSGDSHIFMGENVDNRVQIDWDASENSLEFKINDAGTFHTNILVLKAGDVGIGTATPTEKLEVNGNVKADIPTLPDHLTTKGYVDDAAGAELEDFGTGGLTITTDADPVNATSISAAVPSKYTRVKLEVGGTDSDERRVIEIPRISTGDLNTWDTKKREAANQVINKDTAGFFFDGNDIKGFVARTRGWSGTAASDGTIINGVVKVFKVWGVVR